MKTKLLFTVAFIAFMFATYAQKNIPKKSLLFGGDLSFSSNTFKDANNTESKGKGLSVSPSVAIAIKDNLFIGLTAGYNFYKNSSTPNFSTFDSTILHGYNCAIFIRRYKPLKNNFYLFLQGSLGGYYTKRSIEDTPNRIFYQRYLGINLSLSPGVSYAVNSKLQIETGLNSIFGIGYTRSELADNASYSGQSSSKGFYVYTSLNNFNSQLYFGFRLLLQKKNKAITASKAG